MKKIGKVDFKLKNCPVQLIFYDVWSRKEWKKKLEKKYGEELLYVGRFKPYDN